MSHAMKLWKLTQSTLTFSNTTGFYDSAVVAARDEADAKNTHPNDEVRHGYTEIGWVVEGDMMLVEYLGNDWPSPSEVTVTYLGEAAPGIEAGVVVASYNPE